MLAAMANLKLREPSAPTHLVPNAPTGKARPNYGCRFVETFLDLAGARTTAKSVSFATALNDGIFRSTIGY